MMFILESSDLFRRPPFFTLIDLAYNDIPHVETKIIEEITDSIMKFKKDIKTSEIDMDGIVVKSNSVILNSHIVPNNKYQNTSIAYKYNDLGADTNLLSITHAVSRFGRLTPVGILTPVDLDGSTISKVTLNNYDFIKNREVMLNDRVMIVKSGDIIPMLNHVYKDQRTDNCIPITIPDKCPECNSDTVIISKDLYCTNEKCIGKIRAYFDYVLGKDVLNMKGISRAFIDKIVHDSDFTLLSFLNSTIADLEKIDGINPTRYYNIISSYKLSDFYRLILCLNIPGIGVSQAKSLSKIILDSRDEENNSFDKVYISETFYQCTDKSKVDSDSYIKSSVTLTAAMNILIKEENLKALNDLYNRLMI